MVQISNERFSSLPPIVRVLMASESEWKGGDGEWFLWHAFLLIRFSWERRKKNSNSVSISCLLFWDNPSSWFMWLLGGGFSFSSNCRGVAYGGVGVLWLGLSWGLLGRGWKGLGWG